LSSRTTWKAGPGSIERRIWSGGSRPRRPFSRRGRMTKRRFSG
jgi:hypothetical protein